ncbi:MAG: DNA polymerase III subunit delta' [Candidatus Gygaella obscura]|nr:DNA polymerase III subunit delta' [Candidatus Gygaella obscura]
MQVKSNYDQRKVVGYLKAAISSNRVAHTYLFIGPLGVDKLRIAKDFAKALNCLKGSFGQDCSCQHCLLIDKSQHPDMMVFNSEDNTIKINDIRQIQEKIILRPYMAKTKVVVVPDIERLTNEASNCFLKTLEEPAKNTVIILTVSSASLVLPTILSRCHKINFSCSAKDEVAVWLKDNLGLEKKRCDCLASFTSGRLSLAMELENNNFFELRDKIINSFLESKRRILDSDFLSQISAKGDINLVFSIILTYLRDMRILKSAQSNIALVNSDIEDKLRQSTEGITLIDIDKATDELLKTVNNIDSNLNIKLFLNYLSSKLTRM